MQDKFSKSNIIKGNEGESQKLQNLWQRIQGLSQVQDQSRNEQVPMFFQDNSISKKDSFYQAESILSEKGSHIQHLNFFTHTNDFIEAYEVQNLKQKDQSLKKKSINSIKFPLLSKNEQQQINIKLVEDNKKLFNECIRLKKLFIGLQSKITNEQSNKKQIAKIIQDPKDKILIKELNQKLQNLQKQNKKLKKKYLKEQKLHIDEIGQLKKAFCIEYSALNQKYESSLRQLKFKVQEFQRQTQKSISSTTHESKLPPSSSDRQRILNNMKIVHESELKKLKLTIVHQQSQIKELLKLKK